MAAKSSRQSANRGGLPPRMEKDSDQLLSCACEFRASIKIRSVNVGSSERSLKSDGLLHLRERVRSLDASRIPRPTVGRKVQLSGGINASSNVENGPSEDFRHQNQSKVFRRCSRGLDKPGRSSSMVRTSGKAPSGSDSCWQKTAKVGSSTLPRPTSLLDFVGIHLALDAFLMRAISRSWRPPAAVCVFPNLASGQAILRLKPSPICFPSSNLGRPIPNSLIRRGNLLSQSPVEQAADWVCNLVDSRRAVHQHRSPGASGDLHTDSRRGYDTKHSVKSPCQQESASAEDFSPLDSIALSYGCLAIAADAVLCFLTVASRHRSRANFHRADLRSSAVPEFDVPVPLNSFDRARQPGTAVNLQQAARRIA